MLLFFRKSQGKTFRTDDETKKTGARRRPRFEKKSQAFPQFVSLSRVSGLIDGARPPNAGGDHASRVRPAQIVQQNVVVGFDRDGLGRAGVRVRHQQNGFFRRVDFAVDRVEPVDHGFQLRRQSEIIHRRRESDQIGVDDVVAHEIEIVVEHAIAVHAATVARDAGVDVFERGIETQDGMSRCRRAFGERIRQSRRISVSARTARQNQDFHRFRAFFRRREGFGFDDARDGGDRARRQRFFQKFATFYKAFLTVWNIRRPKRVPAIRWTVPFPALRSRCGKTTNRLSRRASVSCSPE